MSLKVSLHAAVVCFGLHFVEVFKSGRDSTAIEL
jgi:hypothetical protein